MRPTHKQTQTAIAVALLPAAILTFTSCCTQPAPQGAASCASVTAVEPGVAGGVAVETLQEIATVSAIDRANRKVTLVTSDGTKSVVTCGPEVVNFPQLEVGDQVKATVTVQLVVAVRSPGEGPTDRAAAAVALAPVGDKPGGVIASTGEVTATIQTLDLNKRKATLQFPDGSRRTFAVRPDVDMTRYGVGDEVVFRATESVAISVEKP